MMPSPTPIPDAEGRSPLVELAGLFLRLGATSFGGPAGHVAMMNEEVVVRRGWLTQAEFLDYLGATNLIPGPNSTELAMHIGHARAGWRGLVVAGCCFILPAVVIVTLVAWAYVRFGTLPAVHGLLYGIKPVIVAVIGHAGWKLARTAVHSRFLGGLGVVALVLTGLGGHELLILFGSGAVAMLGHRVLTRGEGPPTALLAAGPALLPLGVAAGGLPFGLGPLFLFFLKVGSVLFGSGYVLVAFLQADLVDRWGWLSQAQLLDAVAVGQFTPGPIFTTATFVGYVLGGLPGALAATVGIFLPAFVFVALSGLLLPRLKRSPMTRPFLDGVNVASLALMAVVAAELAQGSLIDPVTGLVVIVSAALLLRTKVNSAWLVLAGGLVGLLTVAMG